VRMVVPLSTLAGRDQLPAELEGFGPILGDLARQIAFDPTGDLQWRASVIDEHGELVADAHLRRQPNPTQVNHVKARDRTCRWPHCARPAMQADLDHTVAVADGGLTLTENLGALCRMHHVAKHNAGWMVTQPVPGTFVHTSLLGQTYVRRQYHRRHHHRRSTSRRSNSALYPSAKSRRSAIVAVSRGLTTRPHPATLMRALSASRRS
jgi:hypothetical protein